MLTVNDISILHSFFPKLGGIGIWISGLAVFLFQNVNDIRAAWETGYPGEIGGLDIGYDVITMVPTTSDIIGPDKKNPIRPKFIQNSSSDP
jgi:hypothetical protein